MPQYDYRQLGKFKDRSAIEDLLSFIGTKTDEGLENVASKYENIRPSWFPSRWDIRDVMDAPIPGNPFPVAKGILVAAEHADDVVKLGSVLPMALKSRELRDLYAKVFNVKKIVPFLRKQSHTSEVSTLPGRGMLYGNMSFDPDRIPSYLKAGPEFGGRNTFQRAVELKNPFIIKSKVPGANPSRSIFKALLGNREGDSLMNAIDQSVSKDWGDISPRIKKYFTPKSWNNLRANLSKVQTPPYLAFRDAVASKLLKERGYDSAVEGSIQSLSQAKLSRFSPLWDAQQVILLREKLRK